jgi:hypothetical protein
MSATSPDFLNDNFYPYQMGGTWSISTIIPTYNNKCVFSMDNSVLIIVFSMGIANFVSVKVL